MRNEQQEQASVIPVLEIFGPTVQGEGMVIGRKTMFVRTAGCDYSCAWCDSAFTWDGSAKEEIELLSAAQIWERLLAAGAERFDHVTLSGGNPALIKAMGPLLELLHRNGITVALETQGSRWQSWFAQIDELTLSPKPPSSMMSTDWPMLDTIVSRLLKKSQSPASFSLKVVVFDELDLQYAVQVRRRYPQVPFYVQAGNEDLTETDQGKLLGKLMQRYEWLVERVMASTELSNVRVLPQLHAWLWGNKRGV